MELNPKLILVLVITTVVAVTILPGSFAQENDQNTPSQQEDISTSDESESMGEPSFPPGRGSGRGDTMGPAERGRGGLGERGRGGMGGREGGPGGREGGEGGGRNGGPGGRGERRGGIPFGARELTEEQIDVVLERFAERDPEKAEELRQLREDNPQQFSDDISRYANPEIIAIILEWNNIERRQRFISWLEQYVPDDANSLAALEDNTDAYVRRLGQLQQKYRNPYERSSNSPELAKILVGQLQLNERLQSLQRQFRTTRDQEEKDEISSEMRIVIGDLYEFDIAFRQLGYQDLLDRMAELQAEIETELEAIEKMGIAENKIAAIDETLEELTREQPRRRGGGGFLNRFNDWWRW